MKIKKFFTSKVIIYTRQWQPGIMVKTFYYQNKKFVRISFPNRQKFIGKLPITDVLFTDVTHMKKLPSPFKKWLFGLVGKKPIRHTYIINRVKTK